MPPKGLVKKSNLQDLTISFENISRHFGFEQKRKRNRKNLSKNTFVHAIVANPLLANNYDCRIFFLDNASSLKQSKTRN